MGTGQAEQLILQGQSAYARNDLATAERLFKQALAVNPVDVTATVSYALVCARTGKRAAGIVYLQNALKRSPDLPEVHAALSTLLFSAGKPEEALQHGERAIELSPNDTEACGHLGRDLANYGFHQDSLRFLERASD